jgi:hypothetical protein
VRRVRHPGFFARHPFLTYAASLAVTGASCLHLLGLNLASLRRPAPIALPPDASGVPAPVA